MDRIAVFCGSNIGAIPEYAAATELLAQVCVRRGIGLVYGGSSVGLMRRLADAVSVGGGEIIGVMPQFLVELEGAQLGLSELRIVRSMHERKALMADLSDGFIALPGGLGTLEEFFEILTWAQLGIHGKPCGLLNVRGYYDDLLRFLDYGMNQQFIKPAHREMVLVAEEPEDVVRKMERYQMLDATERTKKAFGARV